MEETGLVTRLRSGRDVTDPGLEATEPGLITHIHKIQLYDYIFKCFYLLYF
jgi:hypothetical protein